MDRSTLLSATDDLTVNRFDHPPHEVHHDPEREVSDQWSIAFVESGSFDLGALERAKDAAQRGANITRGATAEVRRAFD